MVFVVDIKFVDEFENFDFEKSGKSFCLCRENWFMLYIVEFDESDVELVESRDVSFFEEDVEILSFENESEESVSVSVSLSESFVFVDEDDERDEEKMVLKLKKRSVVKIKFGKKVNGGILESILNK